MRKEVLGFAATAVLIGSAAIGCRNESQIPTIENTPAVVRTVSAESPKTQWDSLPAVDRLNKLLAKDYPSFSDFARQKEVTLATAQAYCEQTDCNVPASEMAESVHYVNSSEFISKLQEELKKDLTSEEKEHEKRSRLAITNSRNEIYINLFLLDLVIKEITNSQPEIIKELGNKDLITAYEISMLAHEFTHKNFPNIQPIKFDGFSIRFPGKQDPIDFETLDRFTIEGRDSQGVPYFIDGGDEAIIDRAARIVVEKKIGLPYISTPEYVSGSVLVRKLNGMAKISDDEFLKYVNGKLPSEDLLRKWGAHKLNKGLTDLKTGVLVLRGIGLAVQGFISFKDAETDINRYLNITNQ